ncbi:hypothetical protein HHK36_019992 [Tetracentron sinense]|uniref:Protein kinase domain-containing protein n=1 Tax=Tetracentron sinense TaxID=13715 RepID=A0A834YQX3_TETSI|nr:hypothetical protein HHK36_019992 [Tetracentron sinense]
MDIWALGCVVTEMVTGRPTWDWGPDSDVKDLLFEIAYGDEMPKIPSDLSDNGKDFLDKCFNRDSWLQWTAERLLNHPFVAEDDDGVEESNGLNVVIALAFLINGRRRINGGRISLRKTLFPRSSDGRSREKGIGGIRHHHKKQQEKIGT